VVSSAYYYTPGISNKTVTSTYNATYTNSYYRARFYKYGGLANRLWVRASSSVDSSGWPVSCYAFQYMNDGRYSVWKHVGGVSTAVKYWTSSSYINRNGWNELGAYVSGSSLYFYINGNLVWSGTDTSLTSGRAGLGMYRGTSTSDTMYVDWAVLTCLSGEAGDGDVGNMGEISPEQLELNAAAEAAGQTADKDGLPLTQ
jgi:hypothetical protein